MDLVKSIRDYIKSCPFVVDEAKSLNIDNILEKPSLSINLIPSERILTEDVVGNKTMERQFLFVARSTTDVMDQYIANYLLFDKISNWFDEQTENKIFPLLEDGYTPQSVKALNNAYIQEQPELQETGVYTITCSFIYIKKGT